MIQFSIQFLPMGAFISAARAAFCTLRGHFAHSSFSQTIRKCHYWHFRLYCMEKKKSSDKMLPRVGLEPRQPLILSPTLSFLH